MRRSHKQFSQAKFVDNWTMQNAENNDRSGIKKRSVIVRILNYPIREKLLLDAVKIALQAAHGKTADAWDQVAVEMKKYGELCMYDSIKGAECQSAFKQLIKNIKQESHAARKATGTDDEVVDDDRMKVGLEVIELMEANAIAVKIEGEKEGVTAFEDHQQHVLEGVGTNFFNKRVVKKLLQMMMMSLKVMMVIMKVMRMKK